MTLAYILAGWLVMTVIVLGMLWLSRSRREEEMPMDMTEEDWADFREFQQRQKPQPKEGADGS